VIFASDLPTRLARANPTVWRTPQGDAVSNHTHRTIPRPKTEDQHLPSSWGGGVWQLAIVAAAAILWVVVDGWGSTESQTAFRQAFIFLSLLALGAAVLFQQLHRARKAAAAKARR
jgi:hypothetical protein